jgi:hypothetical protein
MEVSHANQDRTHRDLLILCATRIPKHHENDPLRRHTHLSGALPYKALNLGAKTEGTHDIPILADKTDQTTPPQRRRDKTTSCQSGRGLASDYNSSWVHRQS